MIVQIASHTADRELAQLQAACHSVCAPLCGRCHLSGSTLLPGSVFLRLTIADVTA